VHSGGVGPCSDRAPPKNTSSFGRRPGEAPQFLLEFLFRHMGRPGGAERGVFFKAFWWRSPGQTGEYALPALL